MAHVIWTPQAQRDLEFIHGYLTQVAPQHARDVVTGITVAVDPLARFSRIGRVVPEFERPLLREVIHANYRIVYAIRDDAVYVLTVLHAAMDAYERLRDLGEPP